MRKRIDEKLVYEALNERILNLTSKFGIQNIDETSLIEKIIKKIDNFELEQIFKETISIEDRLESLKKLLIHKKLGDLTDEDTRLIEETLLLKPQRKIKTQNKSELILPFKD